MKFSLPVILLDELLKWVARNYADGKETGKLSELVVILVAKIANNLLNLPVSLPSALFLTTDLNNSSSRMMVNENFITTIHWAKLIFILIFLKIFEINEINGVFSYFLGCFPNHSFELCPMDGCDEILIARYFTGRVAQMGCQKLR